MQQPQPDHFSLSQILIGTKELYTHMTTHGHRIKTFQHNLQYHILSLMSKDVHLLQEHLNYFSVSHDMDDEQFDTFININELLGEILHFINKRYRSLFHGRK